MNTRLDHFEGSEPSYIRYLEQTVESLRRQLLNVEMPTRDNTITESSTSPPRSSTSPTRSSTSPPRNTTPHLPVDGLHADMTKDVQIIQYHPRCEGLKRLRSTPPPWVHNAQSLIRDTPQAEHWLQALKEKGIFDFLVNGQALSYLLDANTDDVTLTKHIPSSRRAEDLVSGIRTYAQATAKRATFACVALTLANFQKFLVLSTCAVLLAEDAPSEQIMDVVRICMGNDVSDMYCRRMLRTAQYVNELIDTLHMNGWGYRASELLLLWNRTPAYYFPLSCSVNNSLDYLKARLCHPGRTMLEGETGWTPVFVPSLVNQILGQQISIARISQVLGYKNSHLLKIRKNGWR